MHLAVNEVSLSNATLVAGLKVYNPNSFDLTVEELDYRFLLNGNEIARGSNAPRLTLPAQGDKEMEIRLNVGYFSLFGLLRNLQPEHPLDYALLGSVRVGGYGVLSKTIDIDRRGVIDLTTLSRPETRAKRPI